MLIALLSFSIISTVCLNATSIVRGDISPIGYGIPVSGNTTFAGDYDTYFFQAEAADIVLIKVTGQFVNGYTFSPQVTLFSPNMVEVAKNSSIGHICEINNVIVTPGTYTIRIDNPQGTWGSYALFMQKLNNPQATTTIALGLPISNSTSFGGDAKTYIFSADAGDPVFIKLTGEFIDGYTFSPQMTLFAPNGDKISSKATGFVSEISFIANNSGYHTIIVDSPTNTWGSYGMFIQKLNSPQEAFNISLNQIFSGTTTFGGDAKTYFFSAKSGDNLLIKAAGQHVNGYTFSPEIILFATNGTELARNSTGFTASISMIVNVSAGFTLIVDSSTNTWGSYNLFVEKKVGPTENIKTWYWTSNTSITSVTSGDVDKDGNIEIITAGYYFDGTRNVAQLIVWDSSKMAVDRLTTWFWTSDTIINSLSLGDVDNDGEIEIVTGGYFNDGTRNVAQLVEWNGASLAVDRLTTWFWTGDTVINSVAVGDVDGDSQVEVVTGGFYFDGIRNIAQLIEWAGSTLAADRLTAWYWTGNSVINSLAIGDVDSDSQIEIVTGGSYFDGSRDVAQLIEWDGANLAVDRLTGWYWTDNTIINSVSVDDLNANGQTEIVTGGKFYDGTYDNAQLVIWSGSNLAVEKIKSWQWVGNTRINSIDASYDVNYDLSNDVVTGGTFYDGTRLNSQLTVWSVVSTPIYGLNFSPYTDEGQNPNLGTVISEAQITELMSTIKPYTAWVRTFGCSNGLEVAGRVAHELGLKIAVGAWLGTDLSANEREIARLIEIGQAGQADMLIVGSEVLLRGDLTEAQLIGYINTVKVAVPGIPVASADVYSELLAHPNVLAAGDVVLPNYYPYWEGIDVNNAVSYLHLRNQEIVAASGNRPVIISETGWPSAGNQVGEAVPTPENAAYFFQNFESWAKSEGQASFYFEAFDEPWKASTEGPQGAHWGVWDKDGVLKPGMINVFEGAMLSDY